MIRSVCSVILRIVFTRVSFANNRDLREYSSWFWSRNALPLAEQLPLGVRAESIAPPEERCAIHRCKYVLDSLPSHGGVECL